MVKRETTNEVSDLYIRQGYPKEDTQLLIADTKKESTDPCFLPTS
jgi:hypothetical protein